MDGKVVIDVELGTKSFEKQIERTELELQKMQKQYEFLTKINERRANSQEKTYSLTTDEYKMLQKLSLTMDDVGSKNTYTKLEQDIERTNNKLIELNKKQDELNEKDNSGITNSLKGIGNSMEGVIKKVAKWGLAVFGVRSAYMFIRQAMSTLSQYDDKLATDIQYIRYVLASTLKPIIETIINLVYKLLAYIGYIAKAWFGVNIFANASAKAFQKVNKGVKDTNKSAQKLQKTLAGFDEMNILQENGSVGTGGGGGGLTTPSMDLGNLDQIEIPGWVKWIADNKDTIITALKQIASLLLIAFSVKNILEFTNGITNLKTLLDGLGKLLGGMSGLQIFGIIMGLAITIWGIIETIQALTSENVHLEEVLSSVSDAIIGIGLITASFTPWGWVTVGIGLLGNLISAFIDTRTDAEKLEEANKNLEEAQRGVNDAYEEYVNASKQHLNAFKNAEKAEKKLKEISEKLGISTDELERKGYYLYNTIRDGSIKISDLSDEDRELYEAFLDHLDAQARLQTSTDKLTLSEEKLSDAQKNEIKMQLDQQKVLADSSEKYEEYRDAVIEAYEQGAISGEEATGRISEALAETDKESKQLFVDGIPGYMQDMMTTWEKSMGGLGTQWRSTTDDIKIYTDSLASKFNSRFGTDIPKSVGKSIDKIRTLTNLLSKLPFGKSFAIKINSALGGIGNAKGAIYYPPKLAVGGIINQPGRGVPLAMGGERGAEGVIPLTDSQQMQRLGEAIGKYITVNANIVNTMNGRVISRELKQIENDENFAFNGG